MVVDNTPTNVNNVQVENVECYVYLLVATIKENNQDKVIQRIIMAAWAAYVKHWDLFKNILATCAKRQVHTSCMRSATTYRPTVQIPDTDQTSTEQTCGRTNQMGRRTFNITDNDRSTNIWLRERTKVIDVIRNFLWHDILAQCSCWTVKGALCRIWCGVNRLGDSGVKVV